MLRVNTIIRAKAGQVELGADPGRDLHLAESWGRTFSDMLIWWFWMNVLALGILVLKSVVMVVPKNFTESTTGNVELLMFSGGSVKWKSTTSSIILWWLISKLWSAHYAARCDTISWEADLSLSLMSPRTVVSSCSHWCTWRGSMVKGHSHG